MLVDTVLRVLELQPPPAELILVDQTPRHDVDTTVALEALHAQGRIRWIRLPEPSIPRAMNVGLRAAHYDVVVFLDDDTVPEPGLIGAHLRAQQGAPLVAGRVLQRGEEAGGPREHCKGPFASAEPRVVDEFIGCNFSVDRSFALRIGGFDENFVAVAYRYEREFSDRARRAGGQIAFEPSAAVQHLQIPSGGTRSYGSHLYTSAPDHCVGGYYYLLTVRPTGWMWRLLVNPLRAVATRFHLRRPWRAPATLLAEARGILWALRLRSRGPHLLSRGLSE